jgi:hypothetical protein
MADHQRADACQCHCITFCLRKQRLIRQALQLRLAHLCFEPLNGTRISRRVAAGKSLHYKAHHKLVDPPICAGGSPVG